MTVPRGHVYNMEERIFRREVKSTNVNRLLTGVRPLVYLEILRPGEYFTASWKHAGERFLPRVHPYVIDELVLGLEGPAVTRAALPIARVRRALGSAHVFDRDVRHDILEAAEALVASPSRSG